MKKTKIICTMGPNTENPEILKALIREGMDIARFNFSHGSHEEHKAKLDLLKKIREEMNIPVAAMLDTRGPEIRTGLLTDGRPVELTEGGEYTLTTKELTGNSSIGYINYSGLAEDVAPGDCLLIDDGLIRLTVIEKNETDIRCRIDNGGTLGEHKGVNAPGVEIRLPDLTDQDKEDIAFGIDQDMDFIAASFVRSADCIRSIRKILNAFGSRMKIIAKIENQQGVDHNDEIISEADGIMVARGDMGVEIAPEQVPYIQKEIIRKCNECCKPVITATQMLDSMIRNPRPTRAEVGDVANAIYDGTDAIMLSGETAMGKYPVEAVRMMADIAKSTESHLSQDLYQQRHLTKNKSNVTNMVCYSSVSVATTIKARAILAPTMSGFTARMLSKWRPEVEVIGLTPNEKVLRQMQLYWGVRPLKVKWQNSTDDLIRLCLKQTESVLPLKKGDHVVITAGVVNEPGDSFRSASNTNMMRVVTAE